MAIEKEQLETVQDTPFATETPGQKEKEFCPPETPANDPAAALAADMLDNAPEPSPGFVAALEGQGRATRRIKAAEVLTDKAGAIFDRRYCVVGHDNKPRKTARGLWEMRKDPNGKRYSRDMLKTNAADIAADPPQAAPRPKLNLPGQDQEAAPDAAPETAAPPEPAAPVLPPDAVQLAAVVDAGFWIAANYIAAPAAIAEIQPKTSPQAVPALAAYFATLEELPQLPPWLPVVLIYGQATAALVNHKASEPVKLAWKERIARWWLNLKFNRAERRAEENKAAREAAEAKAQ